jgi:hypothetical protein
LPKVGATSLRGVVVHPRDDCRRPGIRALFLASVLGVASCAGDDPHPAAAAPVGDLGLWKSGSRLRARVVTADGGLRVFRSFFDTELGVDCSFRQDENGTWRCLPGVYSLRYADAGCSTQIIVADRCSPRAFGSVDVTPPVDPSSCEPPQDVRYALVAAGSPVPAGDAAVFTKSGETCHEAALQDGHVVLSLGERLDPARAVEAAVHVVERSNGLSARVFEAADGAFFVGDVLAPDERPCAWPYGEFDGIRHCVSSPPLTAGEGDAETFPYFADADCTQPAASPDQECAGPSVVEYFSIRSECPATAVLRAAGEPLSSPYELRDGACLPSTKKDLFAVGGPPDFSGAPAVEERYVGSGAVQFKIWSIGGVPVRAFEELREGPDSGCIMSKFSDGLYRCRSDSWLALDERTFADASCSVPAVVSSGPPKCAIPFRNVVVWSFGSECEGNVVSKVFVLGPLRAEGSYWTKTDAGCSETPLAGTHTMQEVGAEITPPAMDVVLE